MLSGPGPLPVFCSLSQDTPFGPVCPRARVCSRTCTLHPAPATQCISQCLCLSGLFVSLNKCAHGVQCFRASFICIYHSFSFPLYSPPLCFRCLVHLQFICRSVTVEGLEFDSQPPYSSTCSDLTQLQPQYLKCTL